MGYRQIILLTSATSHARGLSKAKHSTCVVHPASFALLHHTWSGREPLELTYLVFSRLAHSPPLGETSLSDVLVSLLPDHMEDQEVAIDALTSPRQTCKYHIEPSWTARMTPPTFHGPFPDCLDWTQCMWTLARELRLICMVLGTCGRSLSCCVEGHRSTHRARIMQDSSSRSSDFRPGFESVG